MDTRLRESRETQYFASTAEPDFRYLARSQVGQIDWNMSGELLVLGHWKIRRKLSVRNVQKQGKGEDLKYYSTFCLAKSWFLQSDADTRYPERWLILFIAEDAPLVNLYAIAKFKMSRPIYTICILQVKTLPPPASSSTDIHTRPYLHQCHRVHPPSLTP